MAKEGGSLEQPADGLDASSIISNLDSQYKDAIARRISLGEPYRIEQAGTQTEEAKVDAAIIEIFRVGNSLDILLRTDPSHLPVQRMICPDEVYSGWENVISILETVSKFGSAIRRFTNRLHLPRL